MKSRNLLLYRGCGRLLRRRNAAFTERHLTRVSEETVNIGR